jgi:hypothetical protein
MEGLCKLTLGYPGYLDTESPLAAMAVDLGCSTPLLACRIRNIITMQTISISGQAAYYTELKRIQKRT